MMMSSGDRQPNSSAGSSEARYVPPGDERGSTGDEQRTPGGKDDQSLLHEVVAETITKDEPLTEAERKALQDVARQYVGMPFDTQPIGVALVESLLALRYPAYDPRSESWRSMSEQIAEAFFSVPQSRARLQQLWERLCETLP